MKQGRLDTMTTQNIESAIAPIVEAQIVETPKKSFALPYKITCSHCGTQKAVRHEVLLKRLVAFKGSIEDRYNAYAKVCTCQNCRREAKNAALEAELLSASKSAE